jgi:hypothetical protein
MIPHGLPLALLLNAWGVGRSKPEAILPPAMVHFPSKGQENASSNLR